MTHLSLIKEEYVICIVDQNTNNEIYSIPLSDLAHKIEDSQSEWIVHMQFKKWMDTETLYNLAQIIEEMYPSSRIDWYETFYEVEKIAYFKELQRLLSTTTEQKTTRDGTEILPEVFDSILYRNSIRSIWIGFPS